MEGEETKMVEEMKGLQIDTFVAPIIAPATPIVNVGAVRVLASAPTRKEFEQGLYMKPFVVREIGRAHV